MSGKKYTNVIWVRIQTKIWLENELRKEDCVHGLGALCMYAAGNQQYGLFLLILTDWKIRTAQEEGGFFWLR